MGEQADRIAANLTAQVETAAKALVLAIVANLIATTPVDTGWARANWIPSIGEPASEPSGDRASVDTGEQEAGQAEVMRFTLDDGVLWVGNPVPYIAALNYGSSTQAPAGFIERAVDLALEEIAAQYAGRAIDVTTALTAFRQTIGAAGAENLASAYTPEGL